jgi:ligand-binding SRPBCC domain-containing protein
MKVYRLSTETFIPASHDTVWNYFATPINLNEMTPPDMSFEILTDVQGVKMYAGMIIQYKVRPLLNIPMGWTTEITHCEEGKYFVDEQRFGPYALWHHQHHFEAVDGGVKMTDTIHYAIGMGVLGRIAYAVYVKNRLEGIFSYREKRVKEIFG